MLHVGGARVLDKSADLTQVTHVISAKGETPTAVDAAPTVDYFAADYIIGYLCLGGRAKLSPAHLTEFQSGAPKRKSEPHVAPRRRKVGRVSPVDEATGPSLAQPKPLGPVYPEVAVAPLHVFPLIREGRPQRALFSSRVRKRIDAFARFDHQRVRWADEDDEEDGDVDEFLAQVKAQVSATQQPTHRFLAKVLHTAVIGAADAQRAELGSRLLYDALLLHPFDTDTESTNTPPWAGRSVDDSWSLLLECIRGSSAPPRTEGHEAAAAGALGERRAANRHRAADYVLSALEHHLALAGTGECELLERTLFPIGDATSDGRQKCVRCIDTLVQAAETNNVLVVQLVQRLLALVLVNARKHGSSKRLIQELVTTLRPSFSALPFEGKRLLLRTCAAHDLRLALVERELDNGGYRQAAVPRADVTWRKEPFGANKMFWYYCFLAPPSARVREASRSPTKTPSKLAKKLQHKNPKGETRLHQCAMRGKAADVAELLEQGADPNTRCNAGLSPLMDACSRMHVEVVRLLLTHGADARAQSMPESDETTALHEALWAVQDCTSVADRRRVRETVELLLTNGADPLARCGKGHNATDVVREASSDQTFLAELKALLSKSSSADGASGPERELAQLAPRSYAAFKRDKPTPLECEELFCLLSSMLQSAAQLGHAPELSAGHVAAMRSHLKSLCGTVPTGCSLGLGLLEAKAQRCAAL